MLSPDIISSSKGLHRTTSEPDVCSELGVRTISNASNCSKVRSRTGTIRLTQEEINSPRIRSYSGLIKPDAVQNGHAVEIKDASKEGSDLLKNDDCGELSWQAFEKLKLELDRAQHDLRKRDDQCKALSKVRDEVDQEVEELTVSLFEEANKMVYEANVGRATAEKKLHEAQLKLDGLQAEVAALKVLVLTSTPSNPGKRGHKRAPSAGQICQSCETYHTENDHGDWAVIDATNAREVDPIVFQLFLSWLEDSCPLKEHPFLTLIHKEDIVPCLRFPNEELAKAVYKAIQNNTLTVEAIEKKSRKCCLSKIVAQSGFRVQTKDSNQWYTISSACRARIVAVVDFLMFLRYIKQGYIKKDVNELYWLMTRKRADMSLAKLSLQKLENSS